jgi:hypothetical protein
MTLPLLMYRRGATLHPADDLAAEDVRKLKADKPILVECRHPRSLQHHRLFFAMLRKVAQSTPTPLSEHALLSWIKVETGHVDVLPLGFGQTYMAPASIAFDKMDQAEFREFFDRAVQLICERVVPSLDSHAAAELLAMLDEPKVAA